MSRALRDSYDCGLFWRKMTQFSMRFLNPGHRVAQALTPHPNPLSKKIGNAWLVEVEHGHNDLGKHGNYTFWYKIVDDPKKAEWGCRPGLNDLN